MCLGLRFCCAPPLLAGVLGCVCLCARSTCAPPLLAWLCGVGVCVWDLCFGCAPPLLAGVLGCVCVCLRALLVARHSWLCRAVWVCVLGPLLRLRHATPGLGCVCVFVCALRLYPATPGWGVRCVYLCLGLCFGCAPPLLAGVFGCWCVCVRASLVPRHSWLGCAVWVCVFGPLLQLRPATPGRGVGVCVCLSARSACTPPLLAVSCGVGVCVWARVLAAPRHSWLGCWGVCVCVRAPLVPRHSWLGCAVWVCVFGPLLWLRPATPGWGVGVCVCLSARSACTPPLLAGVCGAGVCAWAFALAVPPHSWLGCVCVFVCALHLYPATPGWGVRCGCVCLGLCFGCAPPLLAGVLGCVCVCLRALPVPGHSWLCRAVWVCVFGLGFRLRPATPGWGVGVCVFVCALHLYPATPGWGLRCGCVCLGLCFGCAPPLLAGVLGCVCVCLRALLVARHSWLGCAVWVCVLPPLLSLRHPIPGLGVCVCLCACSTCTPPLLAGLCGVGVCVWAFASAAPRYSWPGCWGVCVFVCALCLYPATPGCVVRCGCVCLGSGFGCAPPLLAGVLGCVCVFVCALRLYPATPGSSVRCGWVCLGLCFGCAPPLLAGLFGLVFLCALCL